MNLKRIISYLFLLFFAFSVGIFILCLLLPNVANYLNFFVASYPRAYFASLGALVGFSIFEILVISLPLFIFLALLYINRAKGNRVASQRFVFLLSLMSILPSSYICMIAVPSLSSSLIAFESGEVESSDVILAAKTLSVGVNELSDQGCRELSYTFLSDEFSNVYEALFLEYGLPPHKLQTVKPMYFSKALSYTGALALYSPPTGEINISTEIPDYMTPFTVAHEYAHCLGIAGEGDANILAFVACERSENPSVQYSARLFMLEYLLSDLYTMDKKMYINVYNSLDDKVKSDIRAHAEYSKKYESSSAFRIFEGLNLAHVKIWDIDGANSYSATSLKFAYYLKITKNILCE